MKKLKKFALLLLALLIGFLVGAYLFAGTRARSFVALNRCEGSCLQANELVGLAASIGIRKFTSFVPGVVKETDKAIVLKHSSPQSRIHYLVIPKTDVKNVGDLTDADRDAIFECFMLMKEIVIENNLSDYRVITNGPGYQGATYLHFHFMAL